jgi:hypothetical protein
MIVSRVLSSLRPVALAAMAEGSSLDAIRIASWESEKPIIQNNVENFD